MVFLNWLKRLEFDFLVPEIIENCSFISDKYKKEEHPINVFLHQLSVPLTLAALTCFTYSGSSESVALYGAAAGCQVVGHLIEGLLS
tara:strand:+ start:328 stop:588 length:261 start_codon:yes stop_codon:yes gene_type:complete